MAFFDLLNGFRINGQFPIDSRFISADETARLSIPEGALYEGLWTYQEDTNRIYILDDLDQADHVDGWRELTPNNIVDITGSGTGTVTFVFDDGTEIDFSVPGLRQTNPIVDNSDGTYTFHFQGGADPSSFTTQDFEAKDLTSGTGSTVGDDLVIEWTRKDGTNLQTIVTDGKGDPGEQGESVFFVYADNAGGDNQSFTQDGSREYIAFVVSQNRPTLPVVATFIKFIGTDGANFNPALFDASSAGVDGGTEVTISYNSNVLDTFTVLNGTNGTDGTQTFLVTDEPTANTPLAANDRDIAIYVGTDQSLIGNNYVATNVTDSTTTWTLRGNTRGPAGSGESDVDGIVITGTDLAVDEGGTPLTTSVVPIAQGNTDNDTLASKGYVDTHSGGSNADDLAITGSTLQITENGTAIGTGIRVEAEVMDQDGRLVSSKAVFDGLADKVDLKPTANQIITQPSGTVLDVRGSFDLESNAGDKSLDFSGTSGDIHLEHNSEVYTLVDKDQKKIYYDTTNTDTSFPTTGRAGKEIVIKDDLNLLADEITAIEIERNDQGQTLEDWEDAGNSASSFEADDAFSLTEVSLANNLNLLANDSYSKMIVATENGNNYHFDLLRFQALNGRLILQTDNLVTRLANIDTAISNAGGDATKKEAATSTWQASLADQYVIGDEVTVVRNGNGLINDRRVYIRTNANPGATTTDPGAQTYAIQGSSDPFPDIYISANGNWGLLRRTGIQWRVGQDYIEGDKITQIVDGLPQDYFVIKRHTSTANSKPSDPGTVHVKNGTPDTGNNTNDIFQRPIESIELLTNVPNTVYTETDTGTQVTVGSVGDAAGNTSTFILGTNGIIQQGGLSSDLQVGHLVGFTTTPNDFTTVADNGGNGFEVTIVETVTLGDGNDYTRVTVSGDLNLIAGSNNFLYRLAYQTTLVQAHQLNFNRGIEDTALGGSNPNGLVEIGLTSTGVTAGNYTNTNLTVDEQGRITSASNGSASGGLDLTDYAVQTDYSVNDFVYHKGEIFRCHTAYTSPNASLEVFGPQNQPEHWGAVTENINAIDTLAALELLNTSAGTSATIRVGDYFAVQADTEANRGLYIVTATDNSNPPSGGTEAIKLAGLGGASGGGAVRIATNGSGTATSVPAGGIAIVNATHQYYNVTTAAIEVPVQSSMTGAITYFETTNFLSWVKVGDGGVSTLKVIQPLGALSTTLTTFDSGAGGVDAGFWYWREAQGTNAVVNPSSWEDLVVENGTDSTRHQIVFDVAPVQDGKAVALSTAVAAQGYIFVSTDTGSAVLGISRKSGSASSDYRFDISSVDNSIGTPGNSGAITMSNLGFASEGNSSEDSRFSGTIDAVTHTDTGVNVQARLDSTSDLTGNPITIILPDANTYNFEVGQNISSSNGGVSRTIIRLVQVESGTELILDGHHASEFNNGADIFVDASAHNENTIWTLPTAGATAYTQNDNLINNLIATDHSLEEQIQANATAIAAFKADLVSIAAYQPQGTYLSGAGDITPSFANDQRVRGDGTATPTVAPGYANTGQLRVYHNGDFEIIGYTYFPEGEISAGVGSNAPSQTYVDAFEEQFKTEDIIGFAWVSGAYDTLGFPHVINCTLETKYDNGHGTGLNAIFLNGNYTGICEVRFQGTLSAVQNSDRTFITDHADNIILYDTYTSYQAYPAFGNTAGNPFWNNVRVADPQQIFLINEGVELLHEISQASVPANVGKVLAVAQDQNRVDTFNFPAGTTLSSDLTFHLSRPPSGPVTFSNVTNANITNAGQTITFEYDGAVTAGSFTATYATTGVEAQGLGISGILSGGFTLMAEETNTIVDADVYRDVDNVFGDLNAYYIFTGATSVLTGTSPSPTTVVQDGWYKATVNTSGGSVTQIITLGSLIAAFK